MPALQGVGVLVTRPEQQAMPLCRLLESAGALVWRLPAIVVKPVVDNHGIPGRLEAIETFDLVIFTSANAVRFGSRLLAGRQDLTLAAIGPATARALHEAGYRATVTPAGGFDTENLLLHPLLAGSAGRRILLVKGRHGRELLQDQLLDRGAQVIVAEVYERERVRHGAAALQELETRFKAGQVQVVTATSVEIAAALLDLATPPLRAAFDHVHWLMPGARIAAALRARGVTAPILQAHSADDQDLMAAILRWRSSVSGA